MDFIKLLLLIEGLWFLKKVCRIFFYGLVTFY